MEANYRDEQRFEFVVNCLNQNLEHARHVEFEKGVVNLGKHQYRTRHFFFIYQSIIFTTFALYSIKLFIDLI